LIQLGSARNSRRKRSFEEDICTGREENKLSVDARIEVKGAGAMERKESLAEAGLNDRTHQHGSQRCTVLRE
jgi:hypothetical protein